MEDTTTTEPDEARPRSVRVIKSTFHYRDQNGGQVAESKVLVDEGWFEDVESAIVRREQLNDQNRRLYEIDMARARREHESKVDAAKTRNAEVAVLRNNGFQKSFVDVPHAFVPTPFENYFPDRSFTTYDVEEIRRSEFDGIANAAKG